ncbi:MAG: thioesterase family protein [Frankiaceae bacterium]|nr:thioesterase family protein [Frankiaceae bacterium]MBV9871932.1 thioesterase family protein [Frankiaceae bacterium]
MTSSVEGMLAVFDVTPVGEHRYVGTSDAGDRDLIDASQYLAQAIVTAAKSVPAKTVRRASGVFSRPVRADSDIDFTVEIRHDGRLFASVIVTVSQGERACATVTVLLDVPSADVIRHRAVVPTSTPAEAIECVMPMTGRQLRLVGIADPNDPDHVGDPRIDAWLHYEEVPERADLRRALLAHFTGHLSISATMCGHAGIGTAMSHRTVSTAPMAIEVSFHEPVDWDGWLLYEHESTFVGAGMSYVRGQIRTETGELVASFTQDAMIRPLDDAQVQALAERSRL